MREFNFDGLVGPTHNYAGLSFGNLASTHNAASVSAPKNAALQGLAKMKFLAELGLPQALLPPQERPAVDVLRKLGFSGSDAAVIHKACQNAPEIFRACCSASSMWTANAANVSPSADCADSKVHFTPANLSSKFHRAIETPTTAKILRAIFTDENYFTHHPALPAGEHFADEGAANHTRLFSDAEITGVEIFVYGRAAFDGSCAAPKLFPARQTLEACQAVARLHGLSAEKTLFVQQNPEVIDQGVFHNDVIAVGNGNTLLFHQHAFSDKTGMLAELQKKFAADLHLIEVADTDISVAEAVKCYLFNSQLVHLNKTQMALIAPSECQESAHIAAYLENLCADSANPIAQVFYLDVRESMRNGGGPACLRLRVPLTQQEQQAANQKVFFSSDLYQKLCTWIEKHYRDRLAPEDLCDPQLLDESRCALDELSQLLELGSVYPFQQIL